MAMKKIAFKKLMLLLLAVALIVATAKGALARVYINEIHADLTGTDERWIELYSDTGEDISGWVLTDEEGIYTFPSGSSIGAGEHLVLDDPFSPYGFGERDDIWLYDSTLTVPRDPAALVDCSDVDGDGDCFYEYDDPVNQGGWSVARIHDGGAWIPLSERPTPEMPNNRLPVINRISITDPAYPNSRITCSISASDPDGDEPLSAGYTWTTDGTADVSSFTTATLDLSQVQGEIYGDRISCTAVVSDRIESNTAAARTASTTLRNRAPDISSIMLGGERVTDAAEFTEFVPATLTVIASDDDGDAISIDMSSSTLDGVPLAALDWVTLTDDLVLRFSPGHEEVGDYQMILIVTDGHRENPTDELTIPLIVHAALEILPQSVAVKVNGVEQDAEGAIAVSPGDAVTVQFSFTNNYNRVLGHVETSATTSPSSISDFFPYEGTCKGVNCRRGEWALVPGMTGNDEFTFNVPAAVPLDDFTLDLQVRDDTFWSFLFGVDFSSALSLDFVVERSDVEILLTRATLADNTLTCQSTAELSVELVNAGTYRSGGVAIVPELLVYNRRGITFNSVTGEFTSFSGGTPTLSFEQTLLSLDAGNNTRRVLIDTNTLADGSYTLFVYITNPYLDSSGQFVRGPVQVPFTISPCIASFSPAEDEVIIADGVVQEFSITPGEEDLSDGVVWQVDGVAVGTGEASYDFMQSVPGEYLVTAQLSDEEQGWTVTVTDVPLSENFQTNLPDDVTEEELASFSNFSIWNSVGRITFSQPVDLTDLASLDEVIFIGQNVVAVDGTAAPMLAGIPATVAFFRTFTAPVFESSSGFNAGSFTACPSTRCTLVSNLNNQFTFTVSGFSTYRVRESGIPGGEQEPGGQPTTPGSSVLLIESIKINGKSSGDLSLEEANEVEVTVRNDHTLDMEDVSVTVTIVGIDDDDDLEEESEDFDLDAGDDEEVTLEFDLRSLTLDDESFTVEVLVEGQDTDGTRHESTQSITAELDLEKHKVILDRVTLQSGILQCQRQTGLEVIVKNIGKNDEDDVEVVVQNAELGLELRRQNILLDKFTDDNNQRGVTFTVEVQDAAPGTYPLKVQLFRDDELDDEQELSLDVKACGTASASQQQAQYAGQQLTDELQQQLQARQSLQQQPPQTSFRDSKAYLAVLGVVILLLLAAVITLAVMIKKR